MYPLNSLKQYSVKYTQLSTQTAVQWVSAVSMSRLSGTIIDRRWGEERTYSQTRPHATCQDNDNGNAVFTQPRASQSLSPVQIVPSARTMKTFFFLVKSSDTTKSMTGTGDTFWEIYGLAPQNMGDAIIPK